MESVPALAKAHALPLMSSVFVELKGSLSFHLRVRTSLSALLRACLIKTEYKIAQIRKANEIRSRTHEVVVRTLGRVSEFEPGAAIEATSP